MAKIENDKYYTPPEIAKHCVDKVKEIIGVDNIIEYIEPSAGAGVFLNYFDKPYLAYDIEPEDDRITKADWLKVDLNYKKDRCIIGNPPFGNRICMAQKFYKKSVTLADYVAFILPISQLNNTSSMFEFDLIYSEDLGMQCYTDRNLHCCFNIYKRPKSGELNKRTLNKLKDITIYRYDNKDYDNKEFDIRMCYWGNGSAGKILKDGEKYSAEYKIKINNEELKDRIIEVLTTFNWKDYLDCIAMRCIKQFHIFEILRENVKGIK